MRLIPEAPFGTEQEMRMCCTWLGPAEQYFPEYLNTTAILVRVTTARHNKAELGDEEWSLSQL